MDKLKDTLAKISFLGFRCSSFNFTPSSSYLNGIAPEGINLTMNYGGVKSDDSPNRFIEKFDIVISDVSNETTIQATFVGLFESTDVVDDLFINSSFVKVNAPAILFPFIRSYISTITINAGLEPIILPAINFASKAEGNKP